MYRFMWSACVISMMATAAFADNIDDNKKKDDPPPDPVVEAKGCCAKCKAVFLELVTWKKPKCETEEDIKKKDDECKPRYCVAEPSKVKTPRVYYEEKTQFYCLPKCPCPLAGLFHKCGLKCCSGCEKCCEGGCQDCGKPRKRHVLIKKTANEETDSFKCVVKEGVPVCEVPCEVPCEVDDKCVVLEAPTKSEPTFKPLESAPKTDVTGKPAEAPKPAAIPAK